MLSIGIDYSLTSPCVCVNTDNTFANSKFYFLTDKKSLVGWVYPNIVGTAHSEYSVESQRYENISNWVLSCIPQKTEGMRITIEDYSFGSKGKVFHIAENCGVLKYNLYKMSYTYDTVPPTVIKKFATGKGNATKDVMYEQFVKDTGIKLHDHISPKAKLNSPTTDIVDAWYIAKYSMTI